MKPRWFALLVAGLMVTVLVGCGSLRLGGWQVIGEEVEPEKVVLIPGVSYRMRSQDGDRFTAESPVCLNARTTAEAWIVNETAFGLESCSGYPGIAVQSQDPLFTPDTLLETHRFVVQWADRRVLRWWTRAGRTGT